MFKRISTILFIAILSICCSSLLYSQEKQFQDYSRLLSPEKLYLQTDREVYCIGDTIWFKGYLQNASRLAEYDECNYLYVELISTKYEKKAYVGRDLDVEKVRQRVKVKRTDGRFEGYLPIKEDLNTGIAVLRAYSYWMLNENPAYMFNKSIELRNPMKDDFVKALVAGKYDDNEHYLDIGVKNPFLKEWLKPKVKKETFLDAQFLPESGRYFTDAESVLGVKVINQDGMGMKVHGKILADGRAISSFVTNDVGMGFVRLTVPSGTTSLKAEVESEVENFLKASESH